MELDYHAAVKDLRHAVRCCETLLELPDFLRVGEYSHVIEMALFESAMISFRRQFGTGQSMSGDGSQVRLFETVDLVAVLDSDSYATLEFAKDLTDGVVAHQVPKKDRLGLRSIEQAKFPDGSSPTMYNYHAPSLGELSKLLTLFTELREIAGQEFRKVYNARVGRPIDSPVMMVELQ